MIFFTDSHFLVMIFRCLASVDLPEIIFQRWLKEVSVSYRINIFFVGVFYERQLKEFKRSENVNQSLSFKFKMHLRVEVDFDKQLKIEFNKRGKTSINHDQS